jgi:hypothetical protein
VKQTICDQCGEKVGKYKLTGPVPFRTTSGTGWRREKMDFCSTTCLQTYIDQKLKEGR